MMNAQRVLRGSFLVALMALATACVVAEPREGYYDNGHHRYYGEHTWHECGDRDEHCH
jgi:hypothetical protein